MQLIQSKSILAKLMATENLLVEERKCSTATFDVKNRILTIPILSKKLSTELYDLFTGHEVGHALYTPLEGMKAAIESKTVNSGILNVVEDVRIEKKIQSKFPGLRSSFLKAYNELLDRDFFDTASKDLNQLNLIDRINMHSKGGAQLLIKFSDEEKELLKEVQETETYDEVVEVAKRIQAFMKKQAEEKREEQREKMRKAEDQDGDSPEDFDMYHSDMDFDDLTEDNDDTDYEPSNPADDVKSFTDEAYRRNENRLLDEKSRDLIYMNVPQIDTKKVVFDFKNLYAQFIADNGTLDHAGFQKLRKESEKIVSYLVKEFEMRKNADQMKRASISKTGELNMSKIYSYTFAEELFKKITVVPNGKSHGLVMFIDWSGSMQNHLKGTVKQLFNLVLFCRKVSIPYEVYAFSDNLTDSLHDVNSPKNYIVEPKKGDMQLGSFRLLNILSSRMSSSEFSTACAALCSYCNYSSLTGEHGQMSRHMPRWFGLSSTPLNETIISAMKLVPEFKEKYRLQKVHAVFLTDGEANTIDHVWTDKPSDGITTYGCTQSVSAYHGAIIRDPISREQVYIEQAYRTFVTKGLIQLMKKTIDCTVIGYYLLTSSEMRRNISNFFTSGIQLENAQLDFRRNKFAVIKTAGYDEYYLLKSEESSIYSHGNRKSDIEDDDDTFEVAENATRRGIASAFAKFNAGKMSNRVVLNRFINLIA